MSEIRTTPERLVGLVTTRMKRMDARIRKAITRTAQDAVPMIRKRTPKAFGELRASVQAVEKPGSGPMTPGVKSNVAANVLDAPHAKAVEVGSGPHNPDMKKLEAWVRLRIGQGTTSTGKVRKSWPARGSKASFDIGLTTPRHARNVASRLKAMEVRGRRATKNRDAFGRHLPADAVLKITEAIAKGIRLHGTRPHWMVRNSITEIAATLGRRVRTAVKG